MSSNSHKRKNKVHLDKKKNEFQPSTNTHKQRHENEASLFSPLQSDVYDLQPQIEDDNAVLQYPPSTRIASVFKIGGRLVLTSLIIVSLYYYPPGGIALLVCVLFAVALWWLPRWRLRAVVFHVSTYKFFPS